MWKPLFGNRAPKLPFPFTLPNHWRWWWPVARAWKKKNHQKKWNLGNLCWNGAKLPFPFTLPQPSRSWSSGLGQPRRAFFGACCSTDYYGQKREIQKCSDMRNHDIWIYLNRNTFAPATIPPALKRSLANIHTYTRIGMCWQKLIRTWDPFYFQAFSQKIIRK